jgi:hypothetical protein
MAVDEGRLLAGHERGETGAVEEGGHGGHRCGGLSLRMIADGAGLSRGGCAARPGTGGTTPHVNHRLTDFDD